MIDYRRGDSREVLASLPYEPRFSVLLSDPPYVAWNYITETVARGRLDFAADVNWMCNIWEWACQWWFEAKPRMQTDAAYWLFCHPHYLGFYVRLAQLTGLPWSGMWQCPPDELLLYFGPKLSDAAAACVAVAARQNTYGQDKPVSMLRTLLACSPPGAVLDPFMGGGSTLEAASCEGRTALGVEILDEIYLNACRRLDPLREALIDAP